MSEKGGKVVTEVILEAKHDPDALENLTPQQRRALEAIGRAIIERAAKEARP